MICAIDQSGKKCISWDTEKDLGPFYCPECQCKVQLRKGKIKIHHFAHIPPVNCLYGVGESEEHYRIKKELYEFFSTQSNCTKCELERRLKGVRPDISLYINNKPVAIEIQKSTLSIDNIIKRTEIYTKLGIFILWILPGGSPKCIEHKKTGDKVYRIKEWELFLHSLYYGRLYYWITENKIKVVHFSDYMLYKEYSEWYEDGGDLVSAGGYQFKAKRLKVIVPFDKELEIDRDFINSSRDSFKTGKWTIPECKIYIDKTKKWW
jgi:competence protein CoiA